MEPRPLCHSHPGLESTSVLRGEATGHLLQAARDPAILTLPPLAGEHRFSPSGGILGPSARSLSPAGLWEADVGWPPGTEAFRFMVQPGHRRWAQGWDCSWRGLGGL